MGGGAWSWFADPRAVYYAGSARRTYTGWISRAGDVVVAAHDHDTHSADTTTVGRRAGVDDHNNPALLRWDDGRITVFWPGHERAHMYYRTMRRPEDIHSFGPRQVVRRNTRGRGGFTYPNPVRLSHEGGRVWLFWRGGNWLPTFSIRSHKGWSRARTLVTDGSRRRNRPYIKFASDGIDTIRFAFTESHPGRGRTSIYYAAYRRGSFFSASGQKVGTMRSLPLRPHRRIRVHDGRAARSWIYDVAADSLGRPVIVYATIAHAKVPARRYHRYRYAGWTGSRWHDRPIVAAGRSIGHAKSRRRPGWYAPGLSLDHEDPSVVYLSRHVRGEYEIERWHTPDHGLSWTRQPITSRSREHQLRPVSPRGLTSGEVVLWMRGDYPHYRAYLTSVWMLAPPNMRRLLDARANAG